MGRTDQVLVLTGGSLSYHQLTKAMKAVLTLLLVCLVVQISSTEQEDISDAASNEPNLSLQREVREAVRGCANGDKKCAKKLRKEKRRKKERKVVRSKKGRKAPNRNGNGRKKKFTKKENGKKKRTKSTKRKQKTETKENRKKQDKGTGKSPKKKGGRKKK